MDKKAPNICADISFSCDWYKHTTSSSSYEERDELINQRDKANRTAIHLYQLK